MIRFGKIVLISVGCVFLYTAYNIPLNSLGDEYRLMFDLTVATICFFVPFILPGEAK